MRRRYLPIIPVVIIIMLFVSCLDHDSHNSTPTTAS